MFETLLLCIRGVYSTRNGNLLPGSTVFLMIVPCVFHENRNCDSLLQNDVGVNHLYLSENSFERRGINIQLVYIYILLALRQDGPGLNM